MSPTKFVLVGVIILLSISLRTANVRVLAAEPERLISVLTSPGEFIIRVRSRGCTDADSFRYEIARKGDEKRLTLTIIRLHPDLCKAFLRNGVVIMAQPGGCDVPFFQYSRIAAEIPGTYGVEVRRLLEGSCKPDSAIAVLNSTRLGISSIDSILITNPVETDR
jgi:hypothetical protein